MTIIAKFQVSFLKILNEEGIIINNIPSLNIKNNLKILKDLYKIMVKTRIFDKQAVFLQRIGKIGTYASIYGQEAMSAAIGYIMNKDDVFVPYYRDYAAQIQRGVKMSEILSYWGGNELGNKFSKNHKDFPICIPVSSQCLHAAGIAFALQYKNTSQVVVVSLGDGATSEGDFYEAINIAGVWNLPLVFVVNNNAWAISMPIDKQTNSQTIAQKAIAAGFSGIQIDGNDILSCYKTIHDAIIKARLKKGPTLIESVTYRICDHTTSDDAKRYQPNVEVKRAMLKEPIIRLKKYLENNNKWNQKQEDKLIKNCNNMVQKAIQEYLNIPIQEVKNIFDYNYHKLPTYLITQRANAIEEEEIYNV